MKKLFSLLAVAAMAFTACQNDEGVKNPTLADEGIVNLSVGVPELATRVLDGDEQSGKDSAWGAIDYANYSAFLESEYDVRFQLAVYEANAEEDAAPIYTATNYVDFASTTSFADLRFVPGREYQFVVFADFVPQGTQEDFRYNTADLRNITAFEALNAMDETYDAYFFNGLVKIEAGKVNEVDVTLRRPFGKVRVLTTDLAFVENYAVPAAGEVTFYNHPIYKSFNAVTGEVATEATNAEENKKYDIDLDYYGETVYNGAPATTLFATYILGTEAQETVNFRLDTFEADGSLIKSIDFSTEIPYQRNYLTTIVGNLLTNEADIFVEIDDNFIGGFEEKGDFDNLEEGLGYIREGVLVGGQVYRYETNLFNFRLLSETDGTELREGTYEYGELIQIQNGRAFDIEGIDVEKGTLTIAKDGENYNVKFDIYATINGVTENYILTWNGSLKGAREALATPVVTWEVDEVDNLYITFSWEPVEGAKSYTVEFLGEEQTVEGTSATFDFSGQDTTATAYVTANPEYTWSYTASTATVNVEWKKPIMWGEVEVMLSYVNGSEVAFRAEGLNIYVPNYPSLEDAWYQTVGQIPVSFSAEATLEETTGSAASVVIAEPTIATKFVYYGAMNPIVLTNVKIDWVDGANTIVIAFFNEKNEISFHTAVPLAEGEYTIVPETLVVEGGIVPTDDVEATAFVTLKNDVYTVFFQIESAINDILMQYVGGINFEKPYTPDYKLTNCEAKAETILFTNEDGVVFEIEGTELKSGDVAVKVYNLGAGDQAEAVQTAVAEVTVDEEGEYDVRFTVTAQVFGPAITKKLQYVGPFKAYEATPEPEEAIEFTATYEVKNGLYIFTGVNYDFSIFVNNLATTAYDGTGEDAWIYEWDGALNAPRNVFRNGDFLTVENGVVTIEFTAAVEANAEAYRYKMTCDMNEEPAEPETITVELAFEDNMYVGGNYKIDYYQGAAVVYVQNVERPNNMIDAVTVYDDADELVFEFVDTYNNANVTAIYTKNVVAPATDVEVYLTLENGIYYGLYETTTYAISVEDGVAQAQYADGNKAVYTYEMSENTTFLVFTFTDTVNNVNVTALYQKTDGPAEPVYDNLTILNNNELYSGSKYGYQWHFVSEAGFYGDFYIANGKSTSELVEGEYAWNANYADGAGTPGFTVSMRDANKAIVTVTSASLKVEGKVVYLTVNENYFKGEIATVEPEQPGTDEPVDEWTDYKETAELGKVGSFTVYKSATYQLAGGDWQEIGNIANSGQYETEETATGFIFTFDDEKNKRHVTITYSSVVDLIDWAFSASLDTANGLLTLTGEDGTVVTAKLQGQYGLGAGTYYFNNPGIYNASDATINGVAAEADGTITMNNNTYTITLNMTVNGAKITGTSKNALF